MFLHKFSNSFLIFFPFSLFFLLSEAEISSNQDSYLNALQNSHQTASAAFSRKDYDFTSSSDHSSHSIGDSYEFQPSVEAFASPSSSYGAYGPQKQIYGPLSHPAPVYGPPSPSAPIYGPPAAVHPLPMPIYIHEHPRDSWFWEKFKFKIDLVTIGKLLIKLIIVKKIFKFIALIGLLLIVPKLKNLMKDDDDDEEMDSMMGSRKFSTDKDKLNERISDITNFALTAFDTFSKKYDNQCKRDQVWCRFQRTIDVIDAKYPYEKIVKLYLPDSNITSNEIK